jgi:hypothetical protein
MDGFLADDPVSVREGGEGAANAEPGNLSPISELWRSGVVLVAHRDDKAFISALERGGAELATCGTRGMSETSQGGSCFAPMYPGVEAAL